MKKSMVTLILALVMGIAFNSSDVNPQTGSGMMGSGGTAWGTGAFRSNGERIYFTATSERGTEITYAGGPTSGDWMMMGGRTGLCFVPRPEWTGWKTQHGHDASDGFKRYSLVCFTTRIRCRKI